MKHALLLLLLATVVAGCGEVVQETPAVDAPRMVLVTGATGSQGGAVARELLNRGYRVRGLTRNTESDRAKAMTDLGAEMVQGNFDDQQSLANALQGVHGVFAMTDFWEHGYDKEVQHGKNLVDAAKAAGVQHFVYTSVAGADADTGIPHFDSKGEVEVYIRDSGIDFSIVRPVEFMDNIRYDRENILSGEYHDPRGRESSHQWIAVSDIGFVVGEAFDKPGEWYGRTLEIAGDQLTIGEFVETLSRTLGIDVVHRQTSWEAFEEQSGQEMTEMLRWFDERGYSADVDALRRQYPSFLTYEQYLQSLGWN